ncbi:hypothetical protein JOL79_16490 [Microbispora sp. RL4-1S]|uniref:Transmembrane protein n=1 Tax=Microbispora oryzae TaxID=2806554 RepID=A0A940WR26_9ACTN|nr:hypothetical protein [Microbispora oryzae]MBP2705414.1 hypothetical protein [Microbispora oryzae]
MGSAFLYLAIVVMWLSVLLPMWLRRDKDIEDELLSDPAFPAEDAEEAADEVAEADTVVEAPAKDRSNGGAEPEAPRTDATAADSHDSHGVAGDAAVGDAEAGQRTGPQKVAPWKVAARRRARILARRRRRLVWSILLVLASVVTAAVRVVPWWGVAPSGVLLTGYFLILRVAVRADREQREKAARARAEHLRRQRERRRALAAMAREAEIIQFEARRRVQVFDQYADDRRAVGD